MNSTARPVTDPQLDAPEATFVKQSVSASRWEHTLGVMDLGQHLAETYDLDEDQLRTAALFHDNARSLSDGKQHELAKQYRKGLDEIEEAVPGLWHGPAGAQRMIENFDYARADTVVHAVAFHTTSAPDPSGCLRGLLVADFAEPNRSYPEAEDVRSSIGETDLDELVLTVVDHKLIRTIERGHRVHPRSIRTHNQLCD